ncbi:MAG: hemolysin III family protein [Faecalibacterium sp.]
MENKKVVRKQTTGEELANTLSHGAGALAALVGAVPLIRRAALSGSVTAVFSLGIYAASLVLLYTISAVYHGARRPKVKHILQILDHCSIFLLILGSYLPMSLLVIGGRIGWALFLGVAALAVVGIILNAISLERFGKVSLILYALMGWLALFALKAIVAALPPLGLFLLVAGGVVYTVGIVFYKSQGHYMHFVWHLFVLAGSILHYLCIALYCL